MISSRLSSYPASNSSIPGPASTKSFSVKDVLPYVGPADEEEVYIAAIDVQKQEQPHVSDENLA